jgi:hypothetical protein
LTLFSPGINGIKGIREYYYYLCPPPTHSNTPVHVNRVVGSSLVESVLVLSGWGRRPSCAGRLFQSSRTCPVKTVCQTHIPRRNPVNCPSEVPKSSLSTDICSPKPVQETPR